MKELFPEAVNEDGIDFETLANLLGKREARRERYNFTWAGKQDAILSLHNRSRGTLKPVPEESVNWDDTKNVLIEGDNLQVLKLLYKSYFGRVKMIYIDPPYNTGNELVYRDKFSDPLNQYWRVTGQVDDEGNLQTSDPDKVGHKHSRWLRMMYPRLFLARQLLRDDGVIFVSIDDNEVNNLRSLMNEIFGEENLLAQVIIRANSRGQTYKQIAKTHEYLLVYTRDSDTELNELAKEGDKEDLNLTDDVSKFNIRELRNRNPKFGRHNRPNLFYPIFVNANISDKDGFYPISTEATEGYDTEVLPLNSYGQESCWRWQKTKVKDNIHENTLQSSLVGKKKTDGSFGIYEKYRKTTYKPKSIWLDNALLTETGSAELRELGLQDAFDFPKPTGLIKRCLELATDSGNADIVLDFFAGSATTAHAVLQLNHEDNGNRQFIVVQMAEKIDSEKKEQKAAYDFCIANNLRPTIAEISKHRIRCVIHRMESEKQGRLDGLELDLNEDSGFRVFTLAEAPARQWPDMSTDDTSAEEYATQLELSLSDPLLDGWTIPDVIADVALKEAGFTLSYRVEQIATDLGEDGPTICKVQDDDKEQNFYICLDDEISFGAIKQLDLSRDDLFVFRDSAAGDTTIANLALTCRIKTI